MIERNVCALSGETRPKSGAGWRIFFVSWRGRIDELLEIDLGQSDVGPDHGLHGITGHYLVHDVDRLLELRTQRVDVLTRHLEVDDRKGLARRRMLRRPVHLPALAVVEAQDRHDRSPRRF